MLFSHVFTPLMTKSIGQRIRLTTLPWCLGPGSQAPACCCFKRIYPQSFCWRHHFEVTQCSLTPSDFPIVWAWNMLAHSTASPFCCSAFIRFLLLQSETIKIIIFSFFHFHFHYHFHYHFFILSSFFHFCSSPFAIKLHFFNLQLHFFPFATSFFFVFLCFWWFWIVFHWFSWLSWISGATGKDNEKKMIKKWKFPRVFEDFLVRSENLQLWVQIFIFFFICNFIFFSFSFVFDGFPLFFIVFHGFLGFQVPRARKMKKNDKKMIKKWKKMKKKWKSSSFWRFPGSEWESATLSPNFHFFSFATSFFFHFPLFLMVFHCFSLFFMAFLDFRCHGQGKWKKNDKTMIKKW